MPTWPQYYGSKLVEFSNITAQTGTAYTALNGDIVVQSGTNALTVTLPAIAGGGPVCIKHLGTSGAAITVITTEGSASNIDGIAGTTGTTISVQYAQAVFVSDGGTNWYRVSA